MKQFIVANDTYTSFGDEAVLEIALRFGWNTQVDPEGNIVVEYPEGDQMLFEMLTWEEDSRRIDSEEDF